MKKIGLTAEEIKKHSSHESCWIVIHGNVFDVTDFLPEHPGGQAIILKYAGADATEAYDPIHPPGTIEEYLPTQCHKGKVIESDMKLLVQSMKLPHSNHLSSRNRSFNCFHPCKSHA